MCDVVVTTLQINGAVYAIKEHATFLTTEKLVTGKGSDASNCYDEEAQEEEFSDDEKVGWNGVNGPMSNWSMSNWSVLLLSWRRLSRCDIFTQTSWI